MPRPIDTSSVASPGMRIRNKLTTIIILSTLLAVTLLSSWFVYLRYDSFKTQMSSEFDTITRIIANRITAALVFEDRGSLQENLDSLALHREILLGCIYSPHEKLLTRYARDTRQQDCPANSVGQSPGFADGTFQSLENVELSGEHLGRILVRASTSELDREIMTTLLSTGFLAGLAIIASLFFARHVQRSISDPLTELQDIANKVTLEQDFSLRARKHDENEIGALVDAFNTMLATISRQNQLIGEHTETLERTVAERTQELAATVSELEAFNYSVSHDLKAPLRSIRGFSELLLEDFGASLAPQAQNYLQRVLHNSERMMGLIMSLLELSRISRKELDRQTFALNRMLSALVNELKAQYPERTTSVSIQDNMFITGDEQLIEVIFSNLLGNAFKYSAPKSETRIEIGMTTLHGSPCYFVRDNGIGFDNAQAEQIFQPFSRLHPPEEFEGSGIGLATVARIVSRHRGRIWADSTPGMGSTIYFILFHRNP
jgi:signal transduction histidine kinase